MTHRTIPLWNAVGVLPPVNETNPTSPERSPYLVSLSDFVDRFGTSPDRCRIMEGLLRYRAALCGAGLTQGFQWFDGSFLEQIEVSESRSPNDIDIVTFFRLPAGIVFAEVVRRAPDLFPSNRSGREQLKKQFFVDPYFAYLDATGEALIKQSTYWYGLWSHRRNQTWKGYVEVDLSPVEDAAAASILANLSTSGGQP